MARFPAPPHPRLVPGGGGGRAGEDLSRRGRQGLFPGGEAVRLRTGVAFSCAPRGGLAAAGAAVRRDGSRTGGAAAPRGCSGRHRSWPPVGRRSGRPLHRARVARLPFWQAENVLPLGWSVRPVRGGRRLPARGGSGVAVCPILPSRLTCRVVDCWASACSFTFLYKV